MWIHKPTPRDSDLVRGRDQEPLLFKKHPGDFEGQIFGLWEALSISESNKSTIQVHTTANTLRLCKEKKKNPNEVTEMQGDTESN